MKCDLCPSDAIVECLCLSCADLLWIARLWAAAPMTAELLAITVASDIDPRSTFAFSTMPPCAKRIVEMPSQKRAHDFLDKLAAARSKRRRREARTIAEDAAKAALNALRGDV